MHRLLRFIFLVLISTPIIFLGLVTQSSASIVGMPVDYKEGETVLKGFIAYDDSIKRKRPGILVVHEWWGHNEYARERARQLAGLGYTALAVDMYGNGKQANHPEQAGQFSGEIKNNMAVAKARFSAALKQLNQHETVDATKTAAIGYCFGGAIVLQMAREGFDLDGVVSFHGSLGTSHPAQKGKVKTRVLVLHGAADPFVPPEDIEQFKNEMDQANVDYEFIAYKGAQHSFTNPDADQFGEKFELPLKYHKKADKASWKKMKRFLRSIF